MPIIIDANCTGYFTPPKGDKDKYILKRLLEGKNKIAYNESLITEITNQDFIKIIASLNRFGIAIRCDTKNQEQKIMNMNIKSDDPHIIALAIVSGSMVIYTNDSDLIADLKNSNISKKEEK